MVRKIAALFRPVMKVKARSIHSDTAIPRPTYACPACTPGAYPDKVLLLGNGALAGWGVTDHDDAIPGHLARAMTSRTRHPAEVHLRMDHGATINTLSTLLGGTDVTDFDVIVVICGASDAVQLLAPRKWDTAVRHLSRALVKATAAEIILVGIQPPSTVPVFSLSPGGAVDQHANTLNTLTKAYCTGRVHYLDPPRLDTVGPRTAPAATTIPEEQRVSDGYRAWATTIADKIVSVRPRNPTTLTT